MTTRKPPPLPAKRSGFYPRPQFTAPSELSGLLLMQMLANRMKRKGR